MKRDWDLIRKQLTDVEEENNLLSDVPTKPTWSDQDLETYEKELAKYEAIEGKIFGHLELLVNNGYIDGLSIKRSLSGTFFYGLNNPRLTMTGHDLLDTMRSSTVWEQIKGMATTKGIELSFDAIKGLSSLALKQVLES